MAQHSPLTIAQRESIYRDKLHGRHLQALSVEQHCSYSCARKWWRIGREQGYAGLQPLGRARVRRPVLSTFEPQVAERALHWKRQHPKRGATRILQNLADDVSLHNVRLPKRSSLAAFFQQACPELLQHRRAAAPAPERARRVHERWQLDGKEQVRLRDGSLTTVLTLREPVACVFLGSFAHAVQTQHAWRKLSLRETQLDLRAVFTDFGLPQSIQTDREKLYGQPASEAFPSLFTLWLAGLGIAHHFGRPNQPKDQAQVERAHRTLFDWMAQPEPARDLVSLQRHLNAARQQHNARLPSDAGDCHGRVPLQVHPEVLHALRAYQPGAELALFDLARVDHFLSQYAWHYRVSVVGQVEVQAQRYGIGSAYAGQLVDVRFEPQTRELIFSDAHNAEVVKRCPIKALDVTTITGLELSPALSDSPLQLSFPL